MLVPLVELTKMMSYSDWSHLVVPVFLITQVNV